MNENPAPAGYQGQLDLIERMIMQARSSFADNGHLYLVSGYSVLICAIAQRVLEEFIDVRWSFSVWALLLPVIAYIVWYSRREHRAQRIRTYAGDMISQLWIVFSVLLFLTEIVLAANQQYHLIYPLVILLYGMPTFLVGVVIRFRPLQWGGIACWVFGLVSGVFFPGYSVWAISAAVICAWIIPGHLLNNANKQNAF